MNRPSFRHRSGTAQPASLAVQWLDGDQRGAQVMATARYLLQIEQFAKQALPPALAQVCKVARIERQQITLTVPSAAYASKLRQLAPTIVRLLADNGSNLNEIIVKVQARPWRNETKPAPREVVPLGDSALAAFAELRHNLRPGPLANAIGRLLDHHRK
ncbi:DciA family protein [Parapusillimonas sp. JC17]|uniref:DciA family protein n=1 Tax=Parapusillimonas sp. JC17 TaxID=3445768 RepID=UPI003FA0F677